MELKVIQIGSSGTSVELWQSFLRGKGYYFCIIDGIFGPKTKAATIKFQNKHKLEPDGIVGNKSYGIAMRLGFDGVTDERTDELGASFPPTPAFNPLVSNLDRHNLFGHFQFTSKPLPRNPENIVITDDWESKNIRTVSIPQLTPIKGNERVRFHKLGADQLVALWREWETAGLISKVITWDGSFVPRYVRGSTKTLSNHAFGSAFDINAAWNNIGTLPALTTQKGTVRALVSIANKYGFYWGGHFTRKDGMHFEIARLL